MTGEIFRERADGTLDLHGDFDGLYRADPDPWGQSAESGPRAAYYAESRSRIVAALQSHVGRGIRGLEVGCGHGHVLPGLEFALGGRWDGLDISLVALQRARRLYPEHRFYVGNITGTLPCIVGAYDVVLLNQCWWYIMAQTEAVMDNCQRLLCQGALLAVSHAFLRTPQRYGAEIAEGFHGALRLLVGKHGESFRLIEARYDDSGRLAYHDGLMVFRRV